MLPKLLLSSLKESVVGRNQISQVPKPIGRPSVLGVVSHLLSKEQVSDPRLLCLFWRLSFST